MNQITENSSLEEIADAITIKQNEKRDAIINKGTICRTLYDLEVKKRELLEKKRLAQEVLELIKVDLNLLKDLFWQRKEL